MTDTKEQRERAAVEKVTRQHAFHGRGERIDYCLVCRIEVSMDMTKAARARVEELETLLQRFLDYFKEHNPSAYEAAMRQVGMHET